MINIFQNFLALFPFTEPYLKAVGLKKVVLLLFIKNYNKNMKNSYIRIVNYQSWNIKYSGADFIQSINLFCFAFTMRIIQVKEYLIIKIMFFI